MQEQMMSARADRQAKLERSPTLNTVLMIEKSLYKHKSDKTVIQIWRLLPKKVMWKTYLTVLDYLERSNKIIIEKDRTISWIWDPEGIENLRKRGLIAV
jgi:hypothetical protein